MTQEQTKYIQVEWPEYQYFMGGKRWNECLLVTDETNISSYMVPEDYYNEVISQLKQNIQQ